MPALNILSVISSTAGENETDILYSNIIKNIQTKKSNNNYKLIEIILKQKNKDSNRGRSIRQI